MVKRLIEIDSETFDELMYWLDRCESKGHLENCYDLVEPWANFSWKEVEPVAWANPEDLVEDGYTHSFTVISEQPGNVIYTPLFAVVEGESN